MSMTETGGTSAGPAAQPGQNGFGSGLIAYFAGNPVAANLLMVLLIVGGVLSGLQLVVQYYPDIEARRAAISVLYPGASPQEVEADINRRIEESVVGLPGVERVVSTANQSLGRVTVEMATFADTDAVFNDIQSAIDSIENFPPVRAEQPDVELLKVSHEVMTLAGASSASLSEDGAAPRGGRPARQRDGAAVRLTGGSERHAGPRDRHRAERRGAAPPRTLHRRSVREGETGVPQPHHGRNTDGHRQRGSSHCRQAERRAGFRGHSAHHPARRHDRHAQRCRHDSRRVRRRGCGHRGQRPSGGARSYRRDRAAIRCRDGRGHQESARGLRPARGRERQHLER